MGSKLGIMLGLLIVNCRITWGICVGCIEELSCGDHDGNWCRETGGVCLSFAEHPDLARLTSKDPLCVQMGPRDCRGRGGIIHTDSHTQLLCPHYLTRQCLPYTQFGSQNL